MIISRTPLRISFVGGGSDIPKFYSKFGGAALSMSINKYLYVAINEGFDDLININHAIIERAKTIYEVEHVLIRTVLDMFHIDKKINISIISDIHPKGSGLGSSSALTVGLINALTQYQKHNISKEDLARMACEIEINLLNNPIGKQDQYASSYGGMNFLEFNSDGSVTVSPVKCSKQSLQQISENMLVFYTGIQSTSGEILSRYQNNLDHTEKTNILRKMVELAYQMRQEMDQDKINNFGKYLHENWILKKQIEDSISNPQIDKYYEIGLKNGALGGKLLGAGGRGYIMFYAPKSKHGDIIAALPSLEYMHIKLDHDGSKIFNLDTQI